MAHAAVPPEASAPLPAANGRRPAQSGARRQRRGASWWQRQGIARVCGTLSVRRQHDRPTPPNIDVSNDNVLSGFGGSPGVRTGGGGVGCLVSGGGYTRQSEDGLIVGPGAFQSAERNIRVAATVWQQAECRLKERFGQPGKTAWAGHLPPHHGSQSLPGCYLVRTVFRGHHPFEGLGCIHGQPEGRKKASACAWSILWPAASQVAVPASLGVHAAQRRRPCIQARRAHWRPQHEK